MCNDSATVDYVHGGRHVYNAPLTSDVSITRAPSAARFGGSGRAMVTTRPRSVDGLVQSGASMGACRVSR